MRRRRIALSLGALALAGLLPRPAGAAMLPEIRLSPANPVPACVTPDRLMAFLKRRNGNLSPLFRDIAVYYKQYGEAWRVRWDYAFFQMAIETNFLTYRQPNGRMGDVDPKQNNFAGIGTTGGGVPGDSFPDVATGVLGQIQHLVVYSGEEIQHPVAQRTQLKQVHILERSRALNRPVRFSDLARRWAADPKYGGSIEWVAEKYRSEFCKRGAAPLPVSQPAPSKPKARMVWEASPPSKPAPKASAAARPVASKKAEPVVVASADDVMPVAEAPEAPPAPAPVPAAREEAGNRFALFAPPAGLASAATPANGEAPKHVPDFETPPAGLGVKPGRCVVETAKYAGDTTVLVKAPNGADVHYIAVSVLPGFEASMTQGFLASRPEGGEALGTYPTREAALARARALCAE